MRLPFAGLDSQSGDSPLFCERTFPTLSSYAINHVRAETEAARALQRLIRGELTPGSARLNE